MSDHREELAARLRAFLAYLTTAADESLGSGLLTAPDHHRVGREREKIVDSGEPLIELLESIDRQGVTEIGLEHLWTLLGAAYVIGSRTAVSESFEAALRIGQARRQAETAREVKLRKAAEGHALRRVVILQVARVPLAHTRKFAASILDSVNAALPDNLKVSAATVERDIRLILKERQADQPQS